MFSFLSRLMCVAASLCTAPAWADTGNHLFVAVLSGQAGWLDQARALEKLMDWPGLLVWGKHWTRGRTG